MWSNPGTDFLSAVDWYSPAGNPGTDEELPNNSQNGTVRLIKGMKRRQKHNRAWNNRNAEDVIRWWDIQWALRTNQLTKKKERINYQFVATLSPGGQKPQELPGAQDDGEAHANFCFKPGDISKRKHSEPKGRRCQQNTATSVFL